jgi:hypothetical protein
MVKLTKKKYGGDISDKSALQYILSIGYELECDSLSKFTYENDVLINTDMARDKIITDEYIGDEEEEDDDVVAYNLYVDIRNKEVDDIKILPSNIDHTISDDFENNTLFQITNDISNTKISKYLDKIIESESALYHNTDETDTDIKNSLYTFKTPTKIYPINFVYFHNSPYFSFSNVEWIFTYYKIISNQNIIVKTFINVLKNLFTHLDTLVQETGNLILTLPDDTTSQIIPNPKNRILYSVPNSSVRYLQTDYYEKESDNLDDVCVVPQMTFGSSIENTIIIMKELVTDTIKSIPDIDNNIYDILQQIKSIVDELIIDYNKTAKYKIVDIKISNYLFLFFYKLFYYYNYYLKVEKKGYLKSKLAFNCRHSNYDLYITIKKKIMQTFSVESDIAIQIIIDIICKPEILRGFLNDIKYVQPNAFLKTNILSKENTNYGNPEYSLVSYLNYFENPIKIPNETSDQSLYYDWLLYNGIDNVTNAFPIKDDIVLIEFRGFSIYLSIFIYKIADKELKNSMKYGVCNKKNKYFKATMSGMSIFNLKKFVELYDASTPITAGKRIKRKTYKIKQIKNKTKKIKQKK